MNTPRKRSGDAARQDAAPARPSLLLSRRASRLRRLGSLLGTGLLFLVASASTFAVLFIFIYIIKDALPFFQAEGFREFFTSTRWYPSHSDAEFGALAIIYGSAMVTLGAIVFAVPLGVTAAICLSDVLPFSARQFVKPVIEMLASIPSVAYGFFALVVFAPLLQEYGGRVPALLIWVCGGPAGLLAAFLVGEVIVRRFPEGRRPAACLPVLGLTAAMFLAGLYFLGRYADGWAVSSGTNALNVSIILGIMVLPTIVSVSEDALQAVGREMREGSYALGATRAETMLHVVLPAASGGIGAGIILGLMRAIGETMVVWMASGNATQIPKPWFNVLEPIRTLTATIAGDMGEADQVTGSSRYHVLFAMALLLLGISFACNLMSEWAVRRERRRLSGA